MNRIILLGNGFDLAHGMKSSYNDFLNWYIIKSEEKDFFDKIFEIISPKEKRSITEEAARFTLKHGWKVLFPTVWIAKELFSYQIKQLSCSEHSFIKKLLNDFKDANWVEIEVAYYDELKTILDSGSKQSEKEEKLVSLNCSFNWLKEVLCFYLSTIESSKQHQKYCEIFSSMIHCEDLFGIDIDKDISPDKTMILNFNYTNTVQRYVDLISGNSNNQLPVVNNIHGQLGSTANPPIFGYGDDRDDAYAKMEREKAKGYFDYLKSFWYPKSSNYHNLTKFIKSAPYQICILGHNCGLSDRTMLNMVFGHDNCKSIKIYFHENKDGKNNFIALNQEIARHFENKMEMREKIVSIDRSESMPQC